MSRIAAKFVVLAMAIVAAVVSSPLASGASTIGQGPPTSGTTDVAGSSSYTDFLSAASGFTGTVTFTTSTPDFVIANGNELESVGTLSALDSPYTVIGDDSDGSGDNGTWSYSLTVTPDSVVQGAPTSGSTEAVNSATFTDTLAPSSGFVGPVVFTTSTPGFTIVNGDELETTSPLSTSGSPYTVTGNDSDSYGDTGTWNYSLAVTSDAITQGLPTSSTTSSTSSATFSTSLNAALGFIGPVVFTTSTPGFTIVNGDELETTSPLSTSGSPYTVTGNDSDSYGDQGSWSYVLNVVSTATPIPAPMTLTQISPRTGTISTSSSASFTAGPISVGGSAGTVTFITTGSSSALTVSSSGSISTTGPLQAGTYSVSGTDADTHGDTGAWSYALTVTAGTTTAATATATVTFHANGGRGTMPTEHASAPTALTLNSFVRKGFTFVDWNTLANGSGVKYTNGGLYPFSKSTTLFAHWKKGKVPDRTLTFLANGGRGTMRSEIEDAPTIISADRFARRGYKFLDWNTSANGSGQRFSSGDSYPFKKSRILYAQWKKIATAPTKAPSKAPKKPAHEVAFAPNGGTGSMADERRNGPAALTPNDFRRSGYVFAEWNTRPNGSGTSYTNGARFSFGASATLYAEWKKVTPTTPTFTVPGGVTIGHFAPGLSSLSTAIKSEIQNLSHEIKTTSDTQVTLYGFGDHEASATAADLALGRQRSESVATYLEARLVAIGVKGWTITVAPESPSQDEVGTVVAALS